MSEEKLPKGWQRVQLAPARIALGARVRDTVTGFTGVVIGRCEYQHRTTELQVQPDVIIDGKPVEPTWIPEPRLEETPSEAVPGFGDRKLSGA